MLIFLVGRSSSGQSFIAHSLQKKNSNIKVLDINKIGHYVETLPEVQEKLIFRFGTEILEEVQINQKKMSQIVFLIKIP